MEAERELREGRREGGDEGKLRLDRRGRSGRDGSGSEDRLRSEERDCRQGQTDGTAHRHRGQKHKRRLRMWLVTLVSWPAWCHTVGAAELTLTQSWQQFKEKNEERKRGLSRDRLSVFKRVCSCFNQVRTVFLCPCSCQDIWIGCPALGFYSLLCLILFPFLSIPPSLAFSLSHCCSIDSRYTITLCVCAGVAFIFP